MVNFIMLTDDELEVAMIKARAEIKNRFKRAKNELQGDNMVKELRSNLKKYLSKEKAEIESDKLAKELRKAASELKKYVLNENAKMREELR